MKLTFVRRYHLSIFIFNLRHAEPPITRLNLEVKAHRLDVVTREFFHVSRRYYGTSQGAYLHDKTRRHFGASVSLTYFVSAARKTNTLKLLVVDPLVQSC